MHATSCAATRLANARKSNGKNRQPRPDWRSKLDELKFGLERLEDRALLSITPASTIGANGSAATVPSDAAASAPNPGGPAFPITTIGFLGGAPGDGTPQTFVQNLYQELLGRPPDSVGDAVWVDYLTAHNNAAGQAQVIQGFLNSPEYAIHYITSLYWYILDRAPDEADVQFWTSKMGSPGTPSSNSGSADEKSIVAAFFGSDEFYSKSGNTSQGWINALYEDILDRVPDDSGAAFWANELTVRGAADRDGIVFDLLSTPEAAHDILDNFYPKANGLGVPVSEEDVLGAITGAGWEDLYLKGPYDSQPEGNDVFFSFLEAGGGWDEAQLLLLETSQFYTNPNRPTT